jgi:16S rRNA (guanine966-N2)-methyltransferase
MRIIGGVYRGKKLFSPESDKVRPTSDRAREALFNILNSQLENSLSEYTLLDVFSGSGALGLEAISRGMKNVGLVDIDVKSLSKNVSLFPQEQHKIKIYRLDVSRLPQSNIQYDIVFMDAPYNQGLSEIALNNLATNNWLSDKALCIVEIEKTEKITIPSCYEVLNERVYGLAKLIFLRYNQNN